MDSINKRNTSDFFLPHQQLPPVEQFLKSLGGNDNQFGVNTTLPNLALLRQLSIQGRLRFFTGTGLAGNDAISITPPEGETLFIYGGNCAFIAGASGVVDGTIINNGQSRQTVRAFFEGTSTTPFIIFDSLVGNGIKTFRVAIATSTGRANLVGWVENTSRIRDATLTG